MNNLYNSANNYSETDYSDDSDDLDTIILISATEYQFKVELSLENLLIPTNIDSNYISEIIRVLIFSKCVDILDILKDDMFISTQVVEKLKKEIETNDFLNKFLHDSNHEENISSLEFEKKLIQNEKISKSCVPLKKLNIIMDGSNVATVEISQNPRQLVFSPRRIELTMKALKNIALSIDLELNFIVVLPAHRKYEETIHRIKTINFDLLKNMMNEDFILFTPSQQYDDSYILELAKKSNGLIITNDKFSKFFNNFKF
jgi:hypothetical protein